MLTPPDVLVLGAGGVLGEAWMTGVLAGVEAATGFDLRRCEAFIGTSAGSIVAANLAAGVSPRRPETTTATALALAAGEKPSRLPGPPIARAAARRAGALAMSASAPLVELATVAIAPGGAALRAVLLAGMPRGRESLDGLEGRVERLGVRFDGRLRVIAVDRRRGRRVVFGRPGSPPATVGEAVAASCAVPWLFAPVRIGGRDYLDGGVWSVTNLDVAPAGRGTNVLCLNPVGSLRGQSSLAAARRLARSAVSVETLVLRRRGAEVRTVVPDRACAVAMGHDFMSAEPRARVLRAAFEQGLGLAAA